MREPDTQPARQDDNHAHGGKRPIHQRQSQPYACILPGLLYPLFVNFHIQISHYKQRIKRSKKVSIEQTFVIQWYTFGGGETRGSDPPPPQQTRQPQEPQQTLAGLPTIYAPFPHPASPLAERA